MDISPTGKFLFIGGATGLMIIKKREDGALKKVKRIGLKNVKEIKACSNNCLIIHHGKNNNLTILDKSLKTKQEIKGNPAEKKGKEIFENFNFFSFHF